MKDATTYSIGELAESAGVSRRTVRFYVQQGLLGPTVPDYYVFNLAMADVRNQHVWSLAMIDVAKEGVKPDVAVEKAFKRIEEIFAKYPIA